MLFFIRLLSRFSIEFRLFIFLDNSLTAVGTKFCIVGAAETVEVTTNSLVKGRLLLPPGPLPFSILTVTPSEVENLLPPPDILVKLTEL